MSEGPQGFLFAPGAGASSASAWMRAWHARFSTLGDVRTFDYAYMLAQKKMPDRLEKLAETHKSALLRAFPHSSADTILVGKSMGGRIGCHVSLEQPVRALICMGYPLVGMGGKVRDEILKTITTPVLFVQGDSDAMCPLDMLDEVMREMKAPRELLVVEGANHSLQLPARALKFSEQTQDEVDRRTFAGIQAFVERFASADG